MSTKQNCVIQSESIEHDRPEAQALHSEPPQSISVSVPSLISFVHPGIVGVAVGFCVEWKVGRVVGEKVGLMVGIVQPQALKQASDASRPSAPRTSHRLGKKAETHTQSFKLSPFLYQVGSF